LSNFKAGIIKWIVTDDQPFTVVESDNICNIFHMLNPIAPTISADTVHNMIMEAFKQEHVKVQQILQV